MNIAVLHPQCRVRGGAIKMALLTAQSLKKQGHNVIMYTFDHDTDCFPDLQEGLTIVTSKTTKKGQRDQSSMTSDMSPTQSHQSQKAGDIIDTPHSFWSFFHSSFPRISSIIGIAWDIRQVDIVIANNPPMHIVGVLAKFLSFFSRYHQRLEIVWWHHHVPWYYRPHTHTKGEQISSWFSVIFWKSFFERKFIIPHIKYMIATSYYTAFCIDKYCKRAATVIHPVMTTIVDEPDNTPDSPTHLHNPIVLFTHGRLEPGKGLDTLVATWKSLNIPDVRLVIAGQGSLEKWLVEQGATVISYSDALLYDLQKTDNDILALYLSTIDAFGMAPLEAQIAGLPTVILDKGGARETVLLDKNRQPMAQLIHTENDLPGVITYFIQQRLLHKSVSNVNFCHQRAYFTVSRLDSDIHSLIDSIR